jgi:hypothetical protein
VPGIGEQRERVAPKAAGDLDPDVGHDEREEDGEACLSGRSRGVAVIVVVAAVMAVIVTVVRASMRRMGRTVPVRRRVVPVPFVRVIVCAAVRVVVPVCRHVVPVRFVRVVVCAAVCVVVTARPRRRSHAQSAFTNS